MATTNDFNKSAEQSVQNRISPYDLNQNETEQVWQLVDERNNKIDAERNDFKENWQERFNNELDNLKGQQNPQLQHNLGNRTLPTDMQIRQQAQRNVQQSHLQTIQNIGRDTDNKIDAILDNARQDGRSPQQTQEQNQDWTLTQEFNRQ